MVNILAIRRIFDFVNFDLALSAPNGDNPVAWDVAWTFSMPVVNVAKLPRAFCQKSLLVVGVTGRLPGCRWDSFDG